MTRIALVLATCVAAFFLACTDTPAGGADAGDTDAATLDAAPGDAEVLADAAPAADAGPYACEPDRLWNVIANRPIVVGDFCDDIQLCAQNADVAAAIMAIEPGFVCPDPPGQAGCAAGERACQWFDPDVLDADDYAGLCAISALDSAPDQLNCLVYL